MKMLFGDKKLIKKRDSIKAIYDYSFGVTSILCPNCGNEFMSEGYYERKELLERITEKDKDGDRYCEQCEKFLI